MRMKVTNNDTISHVEIISGSVVDVPPGQTGNGFVVDNGPDMAVYFTTPGGTVEGTHVQIMVENPMNLKTLFWRDVAGGATGSITANDSAFLGLTCRGLPADSAANYITFRISGPY